MRSDYGDSLGKGVRGKYYEAALRAKGLARIDADLLALFPNSKAVNEALRAALDTNSKPKTSRA